MRYTIAAMMAIRRWGRWPLALLGAAWQRFRHLPLLLRAGPLLMLLLLVVLLALLNRRHPAAVSCTNVRASVAVVAKIVGTDVEEPAGMTIINQAYKQVDRADLGVIARYRDHWYLALGDTAYMADTPWGNSNFLVATARYATGQLGGIKLDGYLSLRNVDGRPVPYRALVPDPGYVIPGAMFTVRWHGQEQLFAEYMEGGDFSGHDHWSRLSRIARYDARARIFRPYKPDLYIWSRQDRISTNSTRLQYSFGQDSFWVDSRAGYLYMVGSPTSRFGGIKLARISIASFLAPGARDPWSYYLGHGHWSLPIKNEMAIDANVPWLIRPRDPAFSMNKNYDTARYPAGKDECSYLTIAEFSVIWNPYLHSFLLLTASSACQPNVLWLYMAPTIEGPWTAQAQLVPMPYTSSDPSWDYYAPYTTDSLLRNGGKTLYFVASTYSRYGIHLYRATFSHVPRPVEGAFCVRAGGG